MEAQDSTLKFIIKRMGRDIFSGKGLPHISLPI